MKRTGQAVLITGGASGIGFALARRFHEAGNRVAIAGRSPSALAQAAERLPGISTHVADVALAADRQRLVDACADITVLVNNAGIQFNGALADTTPEQVQYELGVNLLGPVLLAQAFLPHLLRRESAAIINVSSGLALVPQQAAAIYCASKAAMHSFSKSLRWQLEGTSVRVFEVLPPKVATAMNAGRGKGKISPEQLASEFWADLGADRYEMRIGKSKLLGIVNRLSPSLADRIMRFGA